MFYIFQYLNVALLYLPTCLKYFMNENEEHIKVSYLTFHGLAMQNI